VLAIGGVCLVLLLLLPQWNQSIYNSGFYAFAYKYVAKERAQLKQAGPAPVWKQAELFPFPRMPEDLRLIYYAEGLSATVAVVEQENNTRSLLINGKPDASNVATGDMRTQLLLGHLPVLLKGNAQDVLVIGLGSGVTSGAFVTHGVRRIDSVEIEKKVVEAARFFENENLRVLDRKIFRIVLDDGRNFVRHSPGRYDVITSEPSNLWMSGVANLFTREFFVSAKEKLNPSGVMCQWIHLYQISLDDVLIFLKTFHSVFPHLSIWIDESDMLVLGSENALVPNAGLLSQRMSEPAVAWSLRRSAITPEYLMQRYVGDERIVKLLRRGVPLNTDDHPILEFSAPRSLFVNHSAEIARTLIALQQVAEKNKL
jgi:spermidine synthase